MWPTPSCRRCHQKLEKKDEADVFVRCLELYDCPNCGNRIAYRHSRTTVSGFVIYLPVGVASLFGASWILPLFGRIWSVLPDWLLTVVFLLVWLGPDLILMFYVDRYADKWQKRKLAEWRLMITEISDKTRVY